MKSLEIQTNKRLLIVELPLCDIIGRPRIFHDTIGWSIQWKYKRGFRPTKLDFNELRQIVNREAKFKFICRGSDLTEEIAAGMVEGMYDEDYISKIGVRQLYKSDTATYIGNPLNACIERLRKKGWYWGTNPIQNAEEYNKVLNDNKAWDKRRYSQKRLYFADIPTYKQQMKLYNEAESQTFRPEKTLIFETL